MCLFLSRRHPQNAVHILLDNAVFFQLSLDFAVLFVQPRFLLVQLPVLGFQGGQIGQPCDPGVLDGLCRSLVQNELAFMFAPERSLVFGLAVFQHHGPELLVGGEVLYQHRHVPKTPFHIFEGRSRLVVGRADLRDLAFQLGILLNAMLGIDSEEALGRAYIEEMEMLDVPDNVLPYFDFEAYGRDVRINEGGHFAPGGYVFNNGGSFVERYHGMEDIPPEHRIFAYPKLNIREQMAAYQEVIDRSALNEEKQRLPASREER